ncbi:MAG: hypothetical protein ABI321_09845 [Polyangia bacterium]
MTNYDSDDRREAAACVERGIERYSEGQYDAAQNELEAALALSPDHPRALECLSWVREIAAGRRSPSSDTYRAVLDDEPPRPARAVLTPIVPQSVPTGRTQLGIPAVEMLPPLPSRLASNPALPTLPPLPAPPRASEAALPRFGLPGIALPADAPRTAPQARPVPPPEPMERSQLDEAPDSVTREWSTLATSSLPQLDVPELSEEQIANLLDLDRGQGFTLSAGAPVAVDDPFEEHDDEDEVDRTHVRLGESLSSSASSSGEYEVEVFHSHDDDEAPELSPLTVPGPEPARVITQTKIQRPDPEQPREASANQALEEASSLPTNPFGHQRVASAVPYETAASPEALEAAMQQGDRRQIVDLADGITQLGTAGQEALLTRAYELIVGDLNAIPRYGKATPDLDSRSAFLLSRMDGSMSLDDLLDISGMPRADALRVLARLIVAGVVVTQR